MSVTLPNWLLARSGIRKTLALDAPRVMAILNTTPDSFSDGGIHIDPDAARVAAARFIEEGADVIDVGGESTRPGSASVSDAEQIRRVVPAIQAIRREIGDGPLITIDTTRSEVAAAALDQGADAINDVSGGEDDPAMLPLAARRGVGIILMHRLVAPARDSFSDRYAAAPIYSDGVVASVRSFLNARALEAVTIGIPREQIVLDPGLGFGKSVEQNLELIERTPELLSLGFPILSGISRKSFSARAGGLSADTPPHQRLGPTLALSVHHLARGARLFRVHDVAPHVQALRTVWAAMSVAGVR